MNVIKIQTAINLMYRAEFVVDALLDREANAFVQHDLPPGNRSGLVIGSNTQPLPQPRSMNTQSKPLWRPGQGRFPVSSDAHCIP